MRWFKPEFFVLLIMLVPLLAMFFVFSFRKRRALLNLFCDVNLRSVLLPRFSKGKQYFKALLLVLGVFFVVLALCRPQFGFEWQVVKRKGIDILVAVDVSESMQAQDVKPNRLERARREIVDLLRILQGDRVGLIAFAGTSFLECPLTLDYGAVSLFLDYLDTSLIPVQGTSITSVIKLAIKTFNANANREKALILITDGEDHSGEVMDAAQEAAKMGIKIFAIGIGKEGGAPIPSPKGGGFLKDRTGNLILTKLDEETLKEIALKTGGVYVRSITGDLDLEKIYVNEIQRTMKQEDFQSGRKRRWKEHFQWPLALGVFLLLLEPLVSEEKKR